MTFYDNSKVDCQCCLVSICTDCVSSFTQNCGRLWPFWKQLLHSFTVQIWPFTPPPFSAWQFYVYSHRDWLHSLKSKVYFFYEIKGFQSMVQYFQLSSVNFTNSLKIKSPTWHGKPKLLRSIQSKCSSECQALFSGFRPSTLKSTALQMNLGWKLSLNLL